MSVEHGKMIAGISLGGGKRENFFFCLLEHFEKEDRWFLTSLKQVKDEVNLTQDEAITEWVDDSSLKQLVVDFPLSRPACETCELDCPGTEACIHETVVNVRSEINELLGIDKNTNLENPKRYEQERNEDAQIHYSKSVFEKETDQHLLSKPFKRKLKKGFVPYWNRPVDFWIWKNYYDQLLKIFNSSYDSFGNVSVMLLHKFNYLLKHLPPDLSVYESETQLILIEMYRSGILLRRNLMDLQDINICTLARVQVVKQIEEKLGVFIYAKDLEIISKNPRAFNSFLLAIAGQHFMTEKSKMIPSFGEEEKSCFILPDFF